MPSRLATGSRDPGQDAKIGLERPGSGLSHGVGFRLAADRASHRRPLPPVAATPSKRRSCGGTFPMPPPGCRAPHLPPSASVRPHCHAGQPGTAAGAASLRSPWSSVIIGMWRRLCQCRSREMKERSIAGLAALACAYRFIEFCAARQRPAEEPVGDIALFRARRLAGVRTQKLRAGRAIADLGVAVGMRRLMLCDGRMPPGRAWTFAVARGR